MSDDRKDLPPVNAPNFNERLRETISTYLGNRGNKLDRGVTLRDLSEANIIALSKGFLANPGGTAGSSGVRPIAGLGSAATYEIDLTPPPPPDGLSATTSGTSIQVTIAAQTYRQGHGPAKVVVFGAKYLAGGALPTYADAAVLDEFYGDVHAFPVDAASLYRIWAKSVSVDGVESTVAGGTNGVEPVPGLLDDVSIASLTASKIRSGSITVGQFIQASNYVAGVAGWRINGDGTAELANAIVRGGVYASYGNIGGNTIDATGLQSPGYSPGVSGWRLDSSGALNAKTGTFSGNITGASGTFSGSLSGADITGVTGSYTGSLSAATGTFAGSLTAATGTFAGALSAATGTFSGQLTADAINAVNTINMAGNSVTVSNAAAGASTAACSVYVPAGQVMRIIALCQSGPITINSEEKVYLGVSGTFNGVAFSRTSFTTQTTGVGNIQTNDATTYVGYAEVTGPATVSVTANGTDVTCALFGGMK